MLNNNTKGIKNDFKKPLYGDDDMLMEVFILVWKLEKEQISASEKLILLCLANIAHPGGEIYPSYDYLVKRSCYTKRGVINIIDSLCDRGLIKKEIRFVKGKKQHTSNVYKFNMKKLLSLDIESSKEELKRLEKLDEVVHDVHNQEVEVVNQVHHVVNVVHPNIKLNTKLNNNILVKTSFDRFWDQYPRRVKKQEAQRIWKRKKLEGQIETILADLEIRKKTEWSTNEKSFIPHPTTYLNQGQFLDDPSDLQKVVSINRQSNSNQTKEYIASQTLRPNVSHEEFEKMLCGEM